MSQKRILAFVRKMQTLLFLCSAISCKSEFSAKIRNNKTNPATESSCSVAAKANSTDCSEPKVNSVSSLTANGRYGSATTIEVSLTFSENVLVTGIPQLTLETGKTDAVVNYSSGSGSKVLLFAYKPLVGHVTVDLDYVSISSLALNSGTIKSLKGVNANIGLPSPGSLNSLSANKSIVIDTIAPTLTAISAQGTDINTPSLPIKFTIGDSESTLACTSEYLSIATSNESLVLPGSVVFAGNYPECTAVIPPIESATGTVVITLTLRDAAGSSVSVDFNFQIRNAFAIGQPQTTSRLQIENGLFNPRAAAIAGGKLFVADSFNHRVLVYKNVPTTSGQVPTYALGQPNLQSNEVNNGGVSSSSMRFPRGVFSDGIRLFVADSTNNRVLVWNTLPTTSGQAADFALGQPSLTSATANNGGVSGSSLSNPHLVYSDGTKLYVVDKDNHRVLVWTSMPTTSGQSASFALGQPDLVSNTQYNGGVSGSTMGSPQGVFSDGIRLFVADAHRVLVWNSVPTGSGQSASFALGQANLTSSTGNSGGIGAGTMFSPYGIYSDGTRLLVADAGNHRVLVWNTLPTVSGQTADLVLGQPNFTSNTLNNGGVSASSLVSPSGLFVYEGKVYLSDVSNHRLLVWNAFPTVSSQPADFVLGQPNFLSNTINHSGDFSKTFAENSFATSMSQIFCDGTRLFVADTMSSRVLVWNSVPSRSGQPPDFALGQPDLVSRSVNTGGLSAASMYGPSGVFSDGTKLYVADSNNHRVLVWNTMPSSTGQSASFALGQSNLTSNASATTASGMNFPSSVHHNGTKLFVGDSSNNRVLVWNTIPTASGTAANFALGQANLTTGTQNTGGISASRMAAPRSVLSVGTMLFVSDTDNHRILVWNTIPSTSGEAASFALGQPNLTSNTSNNGGLSSSTLSAPYDVYSEGTKVFIADRGNQRVLVWSALPTASGQAATSVIGQPTFTSATPNNGGLSSSALNYPSYVFANSSNLFIADNANDRVLVLPVP